MNLTNRHGRPVDVVPFLVVASLAFLVSFSFGPLYCMALGVALPAALAVCALAFCLATVAAYHRLVWTVRPELRGEVPADRRFRRLVYAAVVGVAVLGLLSLPLLVP